METAKNKYEYDREYARKNMVQVKFTLNRLTDAKMIGWLEEKENKQGYLKELIKNDMEGKKMYEVSLANDSCIFDEGTFDTLKEAIEFSKGRGWHYQIHITRGNPSSGDFSHATLSYDDDKEEFYQDNGWEWEKVTKLSEISFR